MSSPPQLASAVLLFFLVGFAVAGSPIQIAVDAGLYPGGAPAYPLKPQDLDCRSMGNSYSCCQNLNFTLPGPIPVQQSVCLVLTLDPNHLNATIALVVDGLLLLKETWSVYDFADICIPTQLGMSFCLLWKDVSYDKPTRRLSGCAELAVEVSSIPMFSLPFGCFDIQV